MSFETSLVLFTALISFLLAVFIFFRAADRILNQTLALFCLAIAVWTLGQGLGGVTGDKNWVLFLTRVNVGAAALVPAFYLHFIFSLLNLNRKNRNIILWTYVLALAFAALAATPWFVRGVEPVFGLKYYPQAGYIYPLFAFYVASVFLYSFIKLMIEMRRAVGEQYKKLLYVFLASLIGFLGGLTLFLPVFGVNFPLYNHLLLPIVLIIMVFAIVKHKLLDISFIINQGLVYSALTFIFAGFYALAVIFANYYFSYWVKINPILTPLLVVFVAVMVFQPVKDKVQNIVDRLFYRGDYYFQKTINDLSEENKKLFRSLLRADKLASLGTMAAGMAHEIKNPLAALKGMAQILPDNLDDEEFIKDYVEMIPRQIDRISKIVDNLLKAGKTVNLEKREVAIEGIIDEVLSFYAKILHKQGIIIDNQSEKALLVYADPDQIQQVVANLVLNAIQAMPSGGHLTIVGKADGERVVVKVKDTGMGIPAERLDNIFDPFFTLKEEGTGLGLFIAFRILQEHGGEIEVHSQLGKGTEFTLWLPTKR